MDKRFLRQGMVSQILLGQLAQNQGDVFPQESFHGFLSHGPAGGFHHQGRPLGTVELPRLAQGSLGLAGDFVPLTTYGIKKNRRSNTPLLQLYLR